MYKMAFLSSAFETLTLQLDGPSKVLTVTLNRPKKLNAFNLKMWRELRAVFTDLGTFEADIRCVLLRGSGRGLSAGIDLTCPDIQKEIPAFQGSDEGEAPKRECVARKTHRVLRFVRLLQGCLKDARFSVKEVQLGLAADLGTLQVLSRICGSDSLVREWCLTGREFDADEALRGGFVSNLGGETAALSIAKSIASMSPVAAVGTKRFMNEARENPKIEECLESCAAYNASALQTSDIQESALALLTKQPKPSYSRL